MTECNLIPFHRKENYRKNGIKSISVSKSSWQDDDAADLGHDQGRINQSNIKKREPDFEISMQKSEYE